MVVNNEPPSFAKRADRVTISSCCYYTAVMWFVLIDFVSRGALRRIYQIYYFAYCVALAALQQLQFHAYSAV